MDYTKKVSTIIATIAQRIEKFVKLINSGVEGKPVRLKRIFKKISHKP